MGNFHLPEPDSSHSQKDWHILEDEIIFADLVVVEKRIERMAMDKKRGRPVHEEEHILLQQCMGKLEKGMPLRNYPELAEAPLLRGYALLSAKPILTVVNNDEGNEQLREIRLNLDAIPRFPVVIVRGALEKELSLLPPREIEEFLEAYHIESHPVERLIRYSCQVLGLIAFFTVANCQVRSWLVAKGTKALDAAGVIHTDMKKGFIRAEVLAYHDFMASGTYQQAKKEAKVRLEGRDYVVQDGDVLFFRFNV